MAVCEPDVRAVLGTHTGWLGQNYIALGSLGDIAEWAEYLDQETLNLLTTARTLNLLADAETENLR